MDTLEAIHTRRSIRKYQDMVVSDSDIRVLLAAAMQAPSAHNEQPWHFIVVTDKALLEKLASIHVYGRMAKEAAVSIIVCADTKLARDSDFWVQDCSAAVQNLLLAAHSKGLGAVWCGIHPNPERKNSYVELFNLAPNIIPFAEVNIGYPAEQKLREDRFRQDRVHRNKW